MMRLTLPFATYFVELFRTCRVRPCTQVHPFEIPVLFALNKKAKI